METMIRHRLSALSHPGRMAVFRLLMRRYPDAVPAGEIGRALDIKPSTLSVQLATLTATGLIAQARSGAQLRYSACLQAAAEITDFLFHDCCRGRPEVCARTLPHATEIPCAMSDTRYNVLFICTGNSARSIFAEAILRARAGDRFAAHSAGTRPYTELNPFALEVLAQKGHDTSVLRAKTVAEFQGPDAPRFDFVFTVCDRAANEDCPPWPGQPVSAHWGVPDPVAVTGTDAEKSLAFHRAYGALHNRVAAFTALPMASFDRISLQRAVDAIAQGDTTGSRT